MNVAPRGAALELSTHRCVEVNPELKKVTEAASSARSSGVSEALRARLSMLPQLAQEACGCAPVRNGTERTRSGQSRQRSVHTGL